MNYEFLWNICLHISITVSALEMSANPIPNSGIEFGAFEGMSTFYLRIAEARLTAVPKGKLSHMLVPVWNAAACYSLHSDKKHKVRSDKQLHLQRHLLFVMFGSHGNFPGQRSCGMETVQTINDMEDWTACRNLPCYSVHHFECVPIQVFFWDMRT